MVVVLLSTECLKNPTWIHKGRSVPVLHDNNKVVVVCFEENVKVKASKKKGMRFTFVLVQSNGSAMEYCPCVYAFSSDFRQPGLFISYLETMRAADEFFAAARMDRDTLFKSIDRTHPVMFVNGRKVAKAKAKAKATATSNKNNQKAT